MYRKISVITIIFFLLQVCGCWDSQDLEELSFPLAAAYDVHSPSNVDPSDPPAKPGFKVVDLTTLTPNLSPKTQTPVNIVTLSGVTIADARQRMGLVNPDTYVTGLNQTIVVGEELARTGLIPNMDSLFRGSFYFGCYVFCHCCRAG